jgi:hypothetical protein
MNELYYLHGSQSSVDYDIFVVVDLPSYNIQGNHELCAAYEEWLSDIYKDKPVNVNLITINDGQVTWCFKGTVDEINNGLLDTYDLHEQVYPLPIRHRLQRDFELKAIRAVRIILSVLSRTEHRLRIKAALKGDIMYQLSILDEIDLSKIIDFNKKHPIVDYVKIIAFQLGQVYGLYYNKEFYTKEGIGEFFPFLKPYLNRESTDMTLLEYYKGLLVAILKERSWKRTHE